MRIKNSNFKIQTIWQQKGVTIIELLTVIAILMILSLSSFISYRSMLLSNSVNHTQFELIDLLNEARALAINHAEKVMLCASVDQIQCVQSKSNKNWQTGWIVFIDHNQNKKRDIPSEDVLLAKTKLVNQKVLWNRGSYLTYQYDGTINQNGSFYICANQDESIARAVIVNHAGRAYLSKNTSQGKQIKCV